MSLSEADRTVPELGPGSGVCAHHLGATRPLQSYPTACLSPDVPQVSSRAFRLLFTLFFLPGMVPPSLSSKAQLRGPSHHSLPRHPPLGSQHFGHPSDLSRETGCEIQEGLDQSKSLSVPDSQDNAWHVAGAGKRRLNLLTPQSTVPIGGVEFEQRLGRIDFSLEVVNVVQDVQQNLLLPPKERQG